MDSVAPIAGFGVALLLAPPLSRWSGQPVITMHLLIGLLTQLLSGTRMPSIFAPAHNAALACITLAAGSELVVAELRRNARSIAYISCMITLFTIACVFTAFVLVGDTLASQAGSGSSVADANLRRVQAMLAAVVAVGRSPSSAMAIVSELQAEGPLTTTMLSVTMVSDVLVILLFTAACELAHVLYSGHVLQSTRAVMTLEGTIISFCSTVAIQIGLSVVHGIALAYLCRPILDLDGLRGRGRAQHGATRAPVAAVWAEEYDAPSPPPSTRASEGEEEDEEKVESVSGWVRSAAQPALLLVLGGYAFGAEALLKRLATMVSLWLYHAPWPNVDSLRLEPMLACMVGGFWLCNVLRRRPQLRRLLNTCLPPLIAFFFFTTGTAMRVHQLRLAWPFAVTVFYSRALGIFVGNYTGVALAARHTVCVGERTDEERRRGHSGPAESTCAGVQCYGWAAYVTQAGITLGLTDELAAVFPTWGPALQAPLISSVLLTQIVGPPLLKAALTYAGEAHALSPFARRPAHRPLLGSRDSMVEFADVADSPDIRRASDADSG